MQSTPVDTGPLVALFNRNDRWHKNVTDFFAGSDHQLITTWPVLTEVYSLVTQHIWFDFLEWMDSGALGVAEIPGDSIKRVHVLSRKYHDLPMDFADASLIVLAEVLNQADIITIDSDFDVYRFGHNRKFNNLLQLRL